MQKKLTLLIEVLVVKTLAPPYHKYGDCVQAVIVICPCCCFPPTLNGFTKKKQLIKHFGRESSFEMLYSGF